jgi:hypothetical protein
MPPSVESCQAGMLGVIEMKDICELSDDEINLVSGGGSCSRKKGIRKTWCELKERAGEVWDWFFG